MLCIVIVGPTFAAAREQLAKAEPLADIVELRLDCFQEISLPSLQALKESTSLPMIFTLREGGEGEEARLATIMQLASLLPAYIDLESHVPASFVANLSMLYPTIKLIISYHDFEKTPEDLGKIASEVRQLPGELYKFAFMAKNALDVCRLLLFLKEAPADTIAISMGEEGSVSRILGPIFGSRITYAALDTPAAPGQLSATTLIEAYRHQAINSRTKIYALIGYPLENSVSDLIHNAVFTALGLDALYVKLRVQPEELRALLPALQHFGFSGVSVTIPLKEAVLPYLDAIDQKASDIGAVNTLVMQDGKIVGYNTDCTGALDALEELVHDDQSFYLKSEEILSKNFDRRVLAPVRGKRVVILGGGGSAKAIAFEAEKRGAHVTICTRSLEKAKEMKFEKRALSEMESLSSRGYDILINCTPAPLPIDPEHILKGALVMDIALRPIVTPFLEEAQKRGCKIVSGYKMWVNQALSQYAYWFKESVPKEEARSLLISNFTRH